VNGRNITFRDQLAHLDLSHLTPVIFEKRKPRPLIQPIPPLERIAKRQVISVEVPRFPQQHKLD